MGNSLFGHLVLQAADDLEKEVKQLSELNPHKRIVTYFGACYADHPRFKEKCLFVFTEFMSGVSNPSHNLTLIPYLYLIMIPWLCGVEIAVTF